MRDDVYGTDWNGYHSFDTVETPFNMFNINIISMLYQFCDNCNDVILFGDE